MPTANCLDRGCQLYQELGGSEWLVDGCSYCMKLAGKFHGIDIKVKPRVHLFKQVTGFLDILMEVFDREQPGL
jgi:hypothetical protein